MNYLGKVTGTTRIDGIRRTGTRFNFGGFERQHLCNYFKLEQIKL